jgi:hypothetical protein
MALFSVMIRTDALEDLKRRFYAVGNEEKKDLIKLPRMHLLMILSSI